MKINRFFRKENGVYISIDTEGVERRDAKPFIAFDTDVTYVTPLWDKKREEVVIPKHDIVKQVLLLPAPAPQKLLMAGKQPLLLAMPSDSEATIEEIFEAQHVVYFSDTEFRDGAEIITGEKIERWKQRNFTGAKIATLILTVVGLASVLFPSVSLKAAKVGYTVDPTNTTPGLSFAISSDDLVVQNNQGSLPVQTQMNQLVTSTLGLDVSTTGADGYKMYVTTSGTDKKGDYTSALVNKGTDMNDGEGAKINTLSGNVSMLAFPAGYWGYATDAGLQNTTIFKPFSAYDATDTIKYGGDEIASANTAIADEDAAGETPFTIGIKTDNNTPAGKYENELLFTVIANPVTVTYNLNFDGNTTDDSLANVPATITETSSEVFKDIKAPDSNPTRDDFIFVGWAEDADGPVVYKPGDNVTLQVTNINDSQTVNKTLYAVWDKEYLQDFDESTMLSNVGEWVELVDRRDQETYKVKRMADGKVWMIQNLRIGDKNDATILTTEDSAISSSSWTLPAQTDIAFSSPNYNVANYRLNSTYGGYYNWYTATAGTGTQEMTSGDAIGSICPSGWHLPSGGEGGESAQLYSAYNNDASSLAAAFNPEYAGWNNVNNQGVDVYYMTSTVADGDNPYVLYMTANGIVNPNNSLRVYKYYGFSVRCVADADAKVSFNANGGIGTMDPQRFTKGVQQNIVTNAFTRTGYTFVGWALDPDATAAKYTDGQAVIFNNPTTLYAVWEADYMQNFDAKLRLQNVGDTVTLSDSRDDSTYTVRRLEDGKVWMTQNLRYTGGTDPGTTARYNGSFTVDTSESQGDGTITLTSDFGSNYNSSAFAAYRGDIDDGAYYGWTAASKVCPKGWHLMTKNEIVNLNGVYGGTNAAVANAPSYDDLTSSSKANITLSGRYSGPNFNYDGVKGRYWVATEVPETNGSKAYTLAIDKDLSNTVEPANPDGWKYYGFPVRCIANESETISFDANGGVGTMADVVVEKGDNVTLTNAFTRLAYNFAGWATSATGAVVYTNEQIIVAENDMTLYAVWEEKGEILQHFNQDIELLTVGSTKTLYDERDEETYTVKRLPDGKVWMTQNLRYETGAFEVSDEVENGAYYTWETAKTVCPKGWHLPTGGNNGEFAKLDIAYGGSGLGREDSEMAANYHLNTGNWPNMTFNGEYIDDGGTLQYVGVGAYLWSQDRKDDTSVWTFSVGDGKVMPNDYTSAYAMGVRCIADYEEKTVSFNANGGTGTMADVTVVTGQSVVLPDNVFTKDGYEFLGWSTSQNTGSVMYDNGDTVLVMEDMELFVVWQAYMQTANCASLPAGATSTLIDKRDDQAYNVYRFKDLGTAGEDYPVGLSGACIMTEDLALGYTTGETVVKDEDLVLDTVNSAGAGTIKQGASDWSSTNSDDNLQYVNGAGGTYDSHSYYSWPAAQIACPRGWSLPTRQQYKDMISFIGVGTAGSAAFRGDPYYFLYGGRYNGSWSGVGSNARYWTATEYNMIHSFYVVIASGAVNADVHEGKHMGQSVRCMLMP